MAPWPSRGLLGSLRRYVRREVRKHRRNNQTVRQQRDPFLYKLLAGLLQRWVLFCILVVYTISLVGPWPDAHRMLPNWIWASDATIGELRSILRSTTGYFLATQVTLVAIVFPIAVALVTLITQRAHGSSTNAHIGIYYAEALVLPTGLSGIALAVVLAIQMLLLPFVASWPGATSGDWLTLEALIALANLLWLTINALAIGHFLSVSLTFIDPAGRARIRQRFTANRSLPHQLEIDLFRGLFREANAALLPDSSNDDDCVAVYFGDLWSSSSEPVEVAKDMPRESLLLVGAAACLRRKALVERT